MTRVPWLCSAPWRLPGAPAAGAFGGVYAAGGDDLQRRQWAVDIPADVADRLEGAGLVPKAP